MCLQVFFSAQRTQCNLNCVHCISRFSRKTVSHLSEAVRSRLIELSRQGLVNNIATDYSGDILWSEVRYGGDFRLLIEMDVPFHIDTNGVLLNKEMSRRLMASKVKSVNVSLDAGRDPTFRRIRKGAPSLQSIIENMCELSAQKSAHNRTDCRLSASFTLMCSNIDELAEFIEIIRITKFDMGFTRHLEAYTADMEAESLWHQQSRFNARREEALECARMAGVVLHMPRAFEPRPESRGRHVCLEPWRSAAILGNGDVRACCVPGKDTLMGNLNEMTLEEIWNGETYRAFRLRVNTPNAPLACRSCPFVRKENNSLSYRPYLHLDVERSQSPIE